MMEINALLLASLEAVEVAPWTLSLTVLAALLAALLCTGQSSSSVAGWMETYVTDSIVVSRCVELMCEFGLFD